LENERFLVSSSDKTMEVDFDISDFDETLVNAGGWLEYADANY
jgi:3-isopropylmalate/(R)-2-methylmalate dehydratase small subunit